MCSAHRLFLRCGRLAENPTPTFRQIQEFPLQWMWIRTVEADCCTLSSFFLGLVCYCTRTHGNCWDCLKPVCLDRERPLAHVTIVRPSGLLPSLKQSDVGFNMDGVSANANACSMSSSCLKWQPAGSASQTMSPGCVDLRVNLLDAVLSADVDTERRRCRSSMLVSK